MSVHLSPASERRIALLFRPEGRDEARAVLARSRFGLAWNDYYLDRVRFSVLKLSGGDLGALREWMDVAESEGQRDWRDVVYEAGFASKVDAHAAWLADGSDEWPGVAREY